jgi:hypothetical protein
MRPCLNFCKALVLARPRAQEELPDLLYYLCSGVLGIRSKAAERKGSVSSGCDQRNHSGGF